MSTRLLTTALVLGVAAAAAVGWRRAEDASSADLPVVAAASPVAAGEYLTIIGGCNDCHTPGWGESNGAVPSDDRLTGVPLGFRGPWGTSYAANLRLTANRMTSAEWVAMLQGRNGLPPMPWMNVHQANPQDLAAIHAYLVHLGPKGEPMPAAVAPGVEPGTPYVSFMPVLP